MLGVAGDSLSSRIHRFDKLQLGKLIVPNPQIVVADLALREADLLLRVDLVTSQRFWLSHGSRNIFISKALIISVPSCSSASSCSARSFFGTSM